MKKKIITLLLVSIFFMTGCANKDVVKVAFVGGLSGDLSELGVAARNGFLLKVDEVNERGGINGRLIDPIVFDDKNNPDLIPGIYEDLRSDNVEFVVGHILSSLAENVMKEAEKEDILIMSPTMSTNRIDNKDDFLIRTATSNSLQAIKMANTINNDQQKKVIVITDQRNKAYTEEFAEVFEKHYSGSLVVIPYSIDLENTEAIYETIKNYSPDSVLLITPAIDTGLLAQRIKIINNNINLYGVSWAMSTDLIRNGGEAIENMKIVYFETTSQTNEKLKDFKNKYSAKYNEEPIFTSHLTYEISTILFNGLINSKAPSPLLSKNEIINNSFEGIESKVIINEYGDRPGEYQIYQVVNGEFKVLH